MSLSNVTRQAVIAAIAEYDEKGGDAFLAEYGFKNAHHYFLIHEGKEYPSKAIIGVAHKFISSDNRPLAASEFSGGKNTVEKKLKDLGFTVRGPKVKIMHKYWALAANPKIYRIEDAINNLETDLWTIAGSAISKGDRVIVWKTQGDSDNRGIVALGEVISDPVICSDENNPYWISIEKSKQLELRVSVRYIKSPGLPIWIDGSVDYVIQNLSVARAHGGSVFNVTPEQWEVIINTIGGWPEDKKVKLERYADYSRKTVHAIFSPESVFTPQAGTWGLQGIAAIPNNPGDFVFFVTLGQQQGDHIFDEGITTDGVLTWQSQPKQSLQDKQIHQLINHDELTNTIYLFFRTKKDKDYTYLGNLKYLSHDKEREYPVYFQWQILDWDPGDMPGRIGLELQKREITEIRKFSVKKDTLEFVKSPLRVKRQGLNTPTFRSKKEADYAGKEARNKELGFLGEKLVLNLEKKQLIEAGRDDLAVKVRHLSEIVGDGAGYDIESFTSGGEIKYIEVKTTKGIDTTSFFMSSNELAFAKLHKENYYLYRVFEYDKDTNTGKYFILRNIEEELDFFPTQYKVSFS